MEIYRITEKSKLDRNCQVKKKKEMRFVCLKVKISRYFFLPRPSQFNKDSWKS
jgi:hypothetical protein